MSTNDENAVSSDDNPHHGPPSNDSSSAHPDKIIICCDGTSNSEYRSKNPLTNVSRIARCIPPRDGAGRRQIVKYLPGIGTSFQNPFRSLHQAVGGGMKDIIVTAYVFICDNYDVGGEDEGGRQRPRDEIILIGFSRGAFAMRCLADLVSKFGVLRKENINKVHDLFETWAQDRRPSGEDERGQPAEITVCALWDTVSSLAHFPKLQRPAFSFVHSDLRHAGRFNFQALALHERRRAFYPVVMRHPKDEMGAVTAQQVHLEQAWFAGFHTDVGGGKQNDALSHISLIWMMDKLQKWIYFTTEILLHPQFLPLDGWKAARPHKPYSLLQDPMNFAWRLMGNRHRYPQTKFRNRVGWYTIKPNHRHCGSETVHYTVGAMQRVDLIGKVPRLDNYRTDGEWTVEANRGPRRSRHHNTIREGDFSNAYEWEALTAWLSVVLLDLDWRRLESLDLGEFSAVWSLREAIADNELAGTDYVEYGEPQRPAEVRDQVEAQAREGGDNQAEEEYPGIDEGSDGTLGSHHRLARLWRIGRLGRWGRVGRFIQTIENGEDLVSQLIHTAEVALAFWNGEII